MTRKTQGAPAPSRSLDGLRSQGLRNDTATKSLTDGFVFGMDVQFVVNAADVIADGVNADVELSGGALVAVTIGK